MNSAAPATKKVKNFTAATPFSLLGMLISVILGVALGGAIALLLLLR